MPKKSKFILFILIVNLSLCLHAGPDSLIPAEKILELRQSSEKAEKTKPRSAEKRRACKRIVRSGKALISSFPDAPNRFEVLGIMLKNQKIVLELEKKESNRKTLYSICNKLISAPDVYAKLRLEAELLLSDRDLSIENASPEERGQALLELIQRYQGTDAEPKSLMIGAVIAKNLGSDSLLRLIEKTMDERCSHIPEVIAFRRNALSLKSIQVKCKGRYQTSDGITLNIPGDRIGHQCLFVYWSKKNQGWDIFLDQVKKQQELYPGMFEVYSFNLDKLPDAGEKILRDKGLDWRAMHLPDGEKNVFYQAYGGFNPIAIFVNAYGYTILNPLSMNPDSQGWRNIDSGVFQIGPSRLSHDRYLKQLQSLFIGDFLINDTEGDFDPELPPELKMVAVKNDDIKKIKTAIPKEKMDEVQDCFVLPPFRYRLTNEDAIENYRKAEKLCREILKDYADAPDSWIVQNRLIIALLGLWNLLCETKYLDQAVEESNKVLASKTPRGADVVARFCLAKHTLRDEKPNHELVIKKMIEESGGDNSPVSAFAAAAILALGADSQELHEIYRAKILSTDNVYPMCDFKSFLNNRYHRFYLLSPNATRGDRMKWSRGYIVNHGRELSTRHLPDITLKKLDGSELKLPKDENDKLTLLLFVEPPKDPEADFPIFLDRKGKPTKNDYIRRVIRDATMLADTHINKSVEVIIAFICDDPKRVKDLMKKNEWKGQAVMVQNGLKNPLIRRLGILSADKVPNIFLLRRNGTIAWWTLGLRYKQEFGFPFAFALAMKVHIETCEVQQGLKYLEEGEFEKARKTFAGPFKPANPDRYGWRPVRHHGRALALMGLNKWEDALEAVEIAIDAHKRRHYRYPGRGPKRAADWRPAMAEIKIKESCEVFAELWTIKAIILEKLKLKEEAAEFMKKAKSPAQADSDTIYLIFHNKLKVWRKIHGNK